MTHPKLTLIPFGRAALQTRGSDMNLVPEPDFGTFPAGA